MTLVARGLSMLPLLAAGLALHCQAWAAGEAGRAAVCRMGAVELIVGGQDATRDCAPAADPRKAQVTRTASAASPGTGIPTGLQQTRDQERRRILEDELSRERDALAQLQRQGPAKEPAAWTRTQDNIAALNRELTRIAASP